MFPLITDAELDFAQKLQITWGERRYDELSVLASHYDHPELKTEIARLDRIGSDSLGQITSHPLFTWCVNTLVAAMPFGTSHARHISHAISALRVLVLDSGSESNEAWISLDALGRISFPFGAKVIAFGVAASETTIHVLRHADGYTLSFGSSTLSIAAKTESLLELVQIAPHTPVQIWNLPTELIVLDGLSTPYLQSVPRKWNVAPQSPSESTHWVSALEHARQVLNTRGSAFWTVIRKLLTILVPLSQRSDVRQLSCSLPSMPGVVYLSYTLDSVQLVEALVRQSSATLLSLADEDVFEGNDECNLRSPWCKQPSSGRVLLRNAFAAAGVADVWAHLLDSDTLSQEKLRLAQAQSHLYSQVAQALDVVCRHRCLTSWAVELVEGIKSCCAKPRAPSGTTTTSYSDELGTARSRERSEDSELLRSITSQRPDVETAAHRFDDCLRQLLKDVPMRRWLRRLTRRTAGVYFLRWCLPLAELAELPLESPNTMLLLFTHTQLGLLWRYLDVVLDDRDMDAPSAIECYEASMAIVPQIVDSCRHLSVDVMPKDWRFLTAFARYNLDCERNGDVRHQDIWRRGTPFFFIPRRTLRRWPERGRGYKEYMNLIGILDDVIDVWDDLGHDRRTWTTQTLLSFDGDMTAALGRIRRTGQIYTRRLKNLSADRFPILWTLVQDASSALESSLATLENDLRLNPIVLKGSKQSCR